MRIRDGAAGRPGPRGRAAGGSGASGFAAAPKRARCSVSTWQSMSRHPPSNSARAAVTNAAFDASGARVNMLSPKKTRPSATPYSPPTSSPSFQASTEWAFPSRWSVTYAACIAGVIHVPS